MRLWQVVEAGAGAPWLLGASLPPGMTGSEVRTCAQNLMNPGVKHDCATQAVPACPSAQASAGYAVHVDPLVCVTPYASLDLYILQKP